MKRLTLFLLLAACCAASADAQPTRDAYRGGHVEVGLRYDRLSEGFSDWQGLYVQGVFPRGADVWRAEMTVQERFGDPGFLYSLANLHAFGPRWYTWTSVATSSGGRLYYPRFRADVQLGRKWLKGGRFITLVGAGYYDAKDIHRDLSAAFETLFYALPSLVLQASVRWNLSMPGDALARYHYFALTYGHPQRHYLSVRFSFGREAYALIEPLILYADFPSREVAATWRQWLHAGWGVQLQASHYANPYYQRNGLQLGLFHSF